MAGGSSVVTAHNEDLRCSGLSSVLNWFQLVLKVSSLRFSTLVVFSVSLASFVLFSILASSCLRGVIACEVLSVIVLTGGYILQC